MMSHRAAGFSNYLLGCLDAVLAELPTRGFYFDQAEPIGSPIRRIFLRINSAPTAGIRHSGHAAIL